jgi:leucyl aminopeptidase
VIDIATLTGSIMVGLGLETAGLFANNDKLANDLIESGKLTREDFWRMPIKKEHREGIKRDHADLNNCGKGRYADASSAAAFLERFLEKNKDTDKVPEWAHLDIAGTCIKTDGTVTGFGT